jgi:hypothetical protein
VALASYALIEAPFLRLRRRWARSTPRQSKIRFGNRYWSLVKVPRTTALTVAAMVGALAVSLLFAALDHDSSGPSDKAKTGTMAEGKILGPADGKAEASESPLPGREGDR